MFNPTLLSEQTRNLIGEFIDRFDDHLEALQWGVAIEEVTF